MGGLRTLSRGGVPQANLAPLRTGVDPSEDAEQLRRGKPAPLGLRLFETVLRDLGQGVIRHQPQDDAYATWELSWERAPLARPDLCY